MKESKPDVREVYFTPYVAIPHGQLRYADIPELYRRYKEFQKVVMRELPYKWANDFLYISYRQGELFPLGIYPNQPHECPNLNITIWNPRGCHLYCKSFDFGELPGRLLPRAEADWIEDAVRQSGRGFDLCSSCKEWFKFGEGCLLAFASRFCQKCSKTEPIKKMVRNVRYD